jgi:hypothetical protein
MVCYMDSWHVRWGVLASLYGIIISELSMNMLVNKDFLVRVIYFNICFKYSALTYVFPFHCKSMFVPADLPEFLALVVKLLQMLTIFGALLWCV